MGLQKSAACGQLHAATRARRCSGDVREDSDLLSKMNPCTFPRIASLPCCSRTEMLFFRFPTTLAVV